MVSSAAKYIPLVLAIVTAIIGFLQNNPSEIPAEATIITVLTLLYALLHEFETPSTPATTTK